MRGISSARHPEVNLRENGCISFILRKIFSYLSFEIFLSRLESEERNHQLSRGSLLRNDLVDELHGIVGDLLAEAFLLHLVQLFYEYIVLIHSELNQCVVSNSFLYFFSTKWSSHSQSELWWWHMLLDIPQIGRAKLSVCHQSTARPNKWQISWGFQSEQSLVGNSSKCSSLLRFMLLMRLPSSIWTTPLSGNGIYTTAL